MTSMPWIVVRVEDVEAEGRLALEIVQDFVGNVINYDSNDMIDTTISNHFTKTLALLWHSSGYASNVRISAIEMCVEQGPWRVRFYPATGLASVHPAHHRHFCNVCQVACRTIDRLPSDWSKREIPDGIEFLCPECAKDSH